LETGVDVSKDVAVGAAATAVLVSGLAASTAGDFETGLFNEGLFGDWLSAKAGRFDFTDDFGATWRA
tara:strand:+ start:516 stop:716 length:201 start_codon:yes stop_codon:yes gene_type:complete